MARYRVAVTDHVFPNLEPEREVLDPLDAELVEGQCKSREEAIALVRGADAVLNCYYGPIDAAAMDAMPQCRIIVRYGIGVDTIDIPAATERGILVANVPDYCIDEVSDHAVAMALALLRKIPQGDRDVHAGTWSLAPLKPMRRICTLTVGIVGLGRIGSSIARKLAPFGPAILFHDPYFRGEPPVPGARQADLAQLLRESDAIILQAPATPETKHLLNDAAFALMEKQPVVVNCARGELVDTDALVRALQEGRVSAAGLDLIEGVPPLPEGHPLPSMRNVVITPHSAWFSAEALQATQRLAAMEVARGLRGEAPKSLINVEIWKQ